MPSFPLHFTLHLYLIKNQDCTPKRKHRLVELSGENGEKSEDLGPILFLILTPFFNPCALALIYKS